MRQFEKEALSPSRAGGVSLLDVDPDLAGRLPPAQAAVARRHAVASLHRFKPGEWHLQQLYGRERGLLGLFVVDGLLTRDVYLVTQCCSELLGPGDLLRPWDHDDGAAAIVPSEWTWQILEPTRLAVLDRRFTSAIGHWPELIEALVSRTLRRSRSLALLLAIDSLKRIDDRILVLLWHLADRWGRVEPQGVVVPLRLTHQLLAKLSGARRPSVTTALTDLNRRGLVQRRADGTWLLVGGPPEAFARFAAERLAGPTPRPAAPAQLRSSLHGAGAG